MLPILIAVLALVVIFTFTSVKIVPQASVKVIERLGRFHLTAEPGLNIIVPFFDRVRKTIDLREQIMRTQRQPVITRDNVTMEVDCVIYWQVLDPVKVTYEISDVERGLDQLALSSLRNIIGDLDLDHTLAGRDVVNTQIRAAMDQATDRWGVKITRVELMDIDPPNEIKMTMEKQMTAERTRRAVITEAEGMKQAAILRAEGERQAAITQAEGTKQASILEAEGQGQSRLRVADGEAQAFQTMTAALGSPAAATSYLVALKYLEALSTLGDGSDRTIFVPYEATGVLSALGGIRELFGAPPAAR